MTIFFMHNAYYPKYNSGMLFLGTKSGMTFIRFAHLLKKGKEIYSAFLNNFLS